MRLTKEDICTEDNSKRKRDITNSGNTKEGHLVFLKTVKKDERRETFIKRNKDIRTLLCMYLRDVLSITIILIYVFQQLKIRTISKTCS